MEKNIDSMGRIVIPSEIRKQLRINDGDTLNLEVEGNKIVMVKVSTEPFDIRRSVVFHYDPEKLNRVKEKYPIGTLVECIDMNREILIPAGTRGVVTEIGDDCRIYVSWENGVKKAALDEDTDRFKIVK